jgi:hypothetical protein
MEDRGGWKTQEEKREDEGQRKRMEEAAKGAGEGLTSMSSSFVISKIIGITEAEFFFNSCA